MQEKDKIILKDSGLVLVEKLVSLVPGLDIAWGFSKALYGAGLKLRQQKALEWVEMIQNNPGVFTEELLGQPEFQDGFVLALEKYLTERNEEKRRYFRNIFLGFAVSEDLTNFPLERFIHTLSQLGEMDIKVLGDVDISRDDKNYQIYGNEPLYLPNIYNLVSLGLLQTDPSSRVGPTYSPFVWISVFGYEFVSFIKR